MQTVSNNMVVSLKYVLTVDGVVVEETNGEPMEYLHGAEEILPSLEALLTGKQIGDKLSVTLAPEDAYGEYDEDEIEEIDREDIPNVDELEVGMEVEVEDEDGYAYPAQVRDITDKVVVLDFNDRLAGKTLTYDVEVVAIREATPEEIEHGHTHHAGWEDEEDDFDYEYEDENEN